MHELVRTNDIVLVSAIEALLKGADIPHVVLDQNMSILEGSLGMLPSASLGPVDRFGRRKALYEPVHGSAPDIAGKGIANPLACLMSGVMMLNHLHEESLAERVKAAYNAVLADGTVRTRDLGGTAGTDAFADAVIAHL